MEINHRGRPAETRSTSVLQGDETFYNRVISRDSTSSAAAAARCPSSRVFYYRSAAEGVPFNWETQPGTPKNPPKEEAIPPISPPPAVLSLSLPKPSIINHHVNANAGGRRGGGGYSTNARRLKLLWRFLVGKGSARRRRWYGHRQSTTTQVLTTTLLLFLLLLFEEKALSKNGDGADQQQIEKGKENHHLTLPTKPILLQQDRLPALLRRRLRPNHPRRGSFRLGDSAREAADPAEIVTANGAAAVVGVVAQPEEPRRGFRAEEELPGESDQEIRIRDFGSGGGEIEEGSGNSDPDEIDRGAEGDGEGFFLEERESGPQKAEDRRELLREEDPAGEGSGFAGIAAGRWAPDPGVFLKEREVSPGDFSFFLGLLRFRQRGFFFLVVIVVGEIAGEVAVCSAIELGLGKEIVSEVD
ncbi:unnamed protein product [Linum tenue]|uniref:Uncharacterized protein n=1 Tax=Linum tenue TaxID=586396 RepID=A0AAV0IBH2_9ROSI|nr:unnamed protein product [Linum tenue]